MERTTSNPLSMSMFSMPPSSRRPRYIETFHDDEEAHSSDMDCESEGEDYPDHACWRGYYSDEGPFDEPAEPFDDLIGVESE